jgi:acetyl esterase
MCCFGHKIGDRALASLTLDAGGLPSRLYHPRGDEQEVLIWTHGGGWIHGDLDCYEGVARALSD